LTYQLLLLLPSHSTSLVPPSSLFPSLLFNAPAPTELYPLSLHDALPIYVVIVNSCTVTDAADAETRRLARRARREQPDARVIVTGCYAQTQPRAAAAVEAVDHVIGLNRLDALVEAATAPPPVVGRIAVDRSRRETAIATFGARSFPGQTRAFLKVQEGCDLFCTFCIVPMARGRSRSLAPRLVLQEIDALAAAGFEEVVLTGVH